MRKSIFIMAIILFSFGCKNENSEKDIPKEVKVSEISIDEEYAVFNQVLSLIGEGLFYENYQEDYNNRHLYRTLSREVFNLEKRKEVYERIAKENIDTSKVIDLFQIKFVAISDSLVKNEDLKSKLLNFEKINRPKEVILMNWNDPIIKLLDGNYKGIELSRIKFNKDKTKAKFHLLIYRSKGNSALCEVLCEFKNGAWVVDLKKTLMIE